jgi:hypothetical protein
VLIDISCKMNKIRSGLKSLYFDLGPGEAEELAVIDSELAGTLGPALAKLAAYHDGKILSFALSGDALAMEILHPDDEPIGDKESGAEASGVGRSVRLAVGGITSSGYFAVKRSGRIAKRKAVPPKFSRFLSAFAVSRGKNRVGLALVLSVKGPGRFRYFPYLELEAGAVEVGEVPS